MYSKGRFYQNTTPLNFSKPILDKSNETDITQKIKNLCKLASSYTFNIQIVDALPAKMEYNCIYVLQTGYGEFEEYMLN